MVSLIALNCPSCLGRLQITTDIERFTCRHCGAELEVLPDGSARIVTAEGQVVERVLADTDGDGVPDIRESETPDQTPASGRTGCRLPLLSIGMGLFWCCIFPLIFILPPLVTDAGKCALTTAQHHPQVIEEMGEPIRPIFAITFLFSQEGALNQEQYLVVLHGPRGVGLLWISAYMDPTTEVLQVEFEKDGRSYPIYDGPLDCSGRRVR
ncbi:MAG: cytochrome c oxidase assembly factor 1 family protein [Chloroflexi bacterium]|nr:cytochrome c oxidase assembly factor 1 family protein [Chloroflexota bacterium]MBU1749535.1 cytochrome c oxidase assembly factor 1 family protein [Chloroflexota bacterium]